MLLKLAWRNIWRNRQRTIITTASIFFAVMLSIVLSSLQMGIFDNLVNNVVSFYSGYIQIHKAGYWEEQLIDNSFEYNEQIKKETESTSGIITSVPRLESFGLISTGDVTKGVMIVGTQPEEENKLTGLKSKLIAGEYFNSNDRQVLISEGLAKRHSLNIDSSIVLLSQGYHGTSAAGKYRIKGIVKFGSPDLNDKLVYLPLKEAQSMFSSEKRITSLALSISNAEDLNKITIEIRNKIDSRYEVMTWEDMMPEITQHIKTDRAGFFIITGILYLIISFGIFGTILMMTTERQYEFGVLVSIGMKKLKLGSMLILETIFLSLLGVLSGIIASIPIVYFLKYHPIRITGKIAEVYERFGFEALFPTSTDSTHFIVQGLIVLCIAVLISFYPMLNILKLKPIESMKK